MAGAVDGVVAESEPVVESDPMARNRPVPAAAVPPAPKPGHAVAVEPVTQVDVPDAAMPPGAVVSSLTNSASYRIPARLSNAPVTPPNLSQLTSQFGAARSFGGPTEAAAPVLTAAPAAVVADAFGGWLARLSAVGSGVPGESPAAWAVLEAARRFTRQIGLALVGPSVTTGQLPVLPSAATGSTTKITWAWGTYPVINFYPATDKLDFGWMAPNEFDVSENAGSTVIAVVDNNHSYTLQGVGINQLSMANIIASDTNTVTKWQNIIATASAKPPTVSIANAAVVEGNSGVKPLAFTVSLSKASATPVSVGYATANGTATAGSDYTAAGGTLTFAPGVTSQSVNVSVTGDTAVEANETFTVKLSAPSGATLGTATATGTITNDDTAPLPTVSVANAAVVEGNSGVKPLAFTVSLSKASATPVSVGYATANGTATAGSDYTAAGGTLTFAPGVTSQSVNVSVTGDTAVEANETFTVKLSAPSGATLGTATATGTITNDDKTGTAQWGNAFFAPYADMGGWPTPNLLNITRANGGSLFTAAFLQADPNGRPAWSGLSVLSPGGADDQAKAIDSSIRSLKAAGGDVMISMGGAWGTGLAQYYASHGKTAQQLADAYIGVVDYYGVSHVDFDIEGAAITDAPSVALNNQAVKLLQQARPDLQVWYTLPVMPTGLTADGVKVVDSALAAGVKLAGVNLMAMDYGEGAAPTTGPGAKSMSAYAIQAAEAGYSQLSTLHTKYGQTFGYQQLGVTPMIGVNDVVTEVFTVADAQALEDYARAKGLGMIGMWSVTRDTPGDLGKATPTSSGLSDPAGSFSKIFNDYGTVNTINYAAPVV